MLLAHFIGVDTTPSLLQKCICVQVQQMEVTNRFRDGFVPTGVIPRTFAMARQSNLAVVANLMEESLVLL